MDQWLNNDLKPETQEDKSEPPISTADLFPLKSRTEKSKPIGTATMKEDGTILLRTRVITPGLKAEGPVLEYKTDNKDYQTVLKHLGYITPGKTVPLLPFNEALLYSALSPDITDQIEPKITRPNLEPVRISNSPIENVSASQEHVRRVKEAFDNLPPKVKDLLISNGYKIMTADKVTDARPDLKDQHPRGYPPGETWDNTTSLEEESKNQIVISEHYKYIDGKTYTDERVEANVRHETGHAIDRLLDHASDSAEFITAYEKDIANVPPADREKLEYYLQKEGGRSETFAELFGQINGGGAENPDLAALLAKYFTSTREAVRKRLDAI